MLTGSIRSQIDQIWNAFWSGGVANPLSVIEHITYLLFIKRLDDLQLVEEAKAQQLGKPLARRIFPAGSDDKGEPYDNLRWSRFKNFEAREMMRVVDEHVFPFLRNLGEAGSTYGTHMKDARLGFSNPNLLAKVVEMLDQVPMDDRDTKGDVYEYMLGKIASAGQNGQFRTPRHIINLMVNLMKPAPQDVAQIERDGADPRSIANGAAYLGLEHIESGGRILGAVEVSKGDLASTKFRFTSEHVLYGKLRPYLAKIALPDFDGICSTDIVPVRPSCRLDRRYLAHFLRQPSMVEFASSRATGANLNPFVEGAEIVTRHKTVRTRTSPRDLMDPETGEAVGQSIIHVIEESTHMGLLRKPVRQARMAYKTCAGEVGFQLGRHGHMPMLKAAFRRLDLCPLPASLGGAAGQGSEPVPIVNWQSSFPA